MGISRKLKILLFALITVLTAVFTGCTGDIQMSIDTVLTVDDQFKGSREMTAVVSNTVYKQAFNSDLTTLQNFVTTKCPSTMRCTAEKVSEGVKITMYLDFESYDDYTNKTGQILARTPGIYYDTSKTIFKKGYALSEDFSSKELFEWLVEAIKEDSDQLNDITIDDLFTDGVTKVVYNGEEVVTDAKINISDMESTTFDSLSVELTMNYDETFVVNMNFIVSNEVYYTMGDKMDSAIKRLVPDGGVYSVTDVDEQRVYTISFSTYNTDTLIEQLNSVLHSEKCEFSMVESGDEDDPSQAHREIVMFIDGSYFLDFSKEETELVYKLKIDPTYSFDSCESLTGFLHNYNYTQDSEYTTVICTVGPSDKVRIGLSYAVDMKNIEIKTQVISEEEINRTITFSYDRANAKLSGDNFEEKIKSRMDDEMTLDISKTDSGTDYVVSFTASGTEELSNRTTAFLDGSATEDALTSTITGGKGEKNIRTKEFAYDDILDFQWLLGSVNVTKGITYTFIYPEGYTAEFNGTSYSNMSNEKNMISCSTNDKSIEVKSKATAVNMTGMIQLILLLFSLSFTIIASIVNMKHIIGFIKSGKDYLMENDLFKGKTMVWMSIGIIVVVILLFTLIRMIFRIY